MKFKIKALDDLTDNSEHPEAETTIVDGTEITQKEIDSLLAALEAWTNGYNDNIPDELDMVEPYPQYARFIEKIGIEPHKEDKVSSTGHSRALYFFNFTGVPNKQKWRDIGDVEKIKEAAKWAGLKYKQGHKDNMQTGRGHDYLIIIKK